MQYAHVDAQIKDSSQTRERELFIDNLLVRIHIVIEMIRLTGLAPWEFEDPFSGSLISAHRLSGPRWGAWILTLEKSGLSPKVVE